MRRPWRNWDWNVRSCGRHGHVTWAPTEEGLAARLQVDTVDGVAWRCLRCGSFVPGPPHGSGPAADAPLVLRGKALRDAFILRLLAAERLIRGVLLVALAYGIYRFNGAQNSLEQVFRSDLPLLRPLADRLGIDLQSAGPVRLIQRLLTTDHTTLKWITIGVLAYGVLELVEGIGLWLMQRWGEYVAVIGTGAFIPLEIYELVDRVTYLKLGAFVLNVFAVVYIVWTKHLFGFRGGKAAFEAEQHSQSLLEVEQAAA